ncbi:MAG TPA: hypothetical protein VEW46_13400 [Pyrinomonadaceae bacterium]|nr:hypothetical protein [Pyrinomonadaceae bacterium]
MPQSIDAIGRLKKIKTSHHNDGHIAITVPAAIGIQAALIKASPEKFYKPPYVGFSVASCGFVDHLLCRAAGTKIHGADEKRVYRNSYSAAL